MCSYGESRLDYKRRIAQTSFVWLLCLIGRWKMYSCRNAKKRHHYGPSYQTPNTRFLLWILFFYIPCAIMRNFAPPPCKCKWSTRNFFWGGGLGFKNDSSYLIPPPPMKSEMLSLFFSCLFPPFYSPPFIKDWGRGICTTRKLSW